MSSLIAQSRWAKVADQFGQRLNPAEQAAVLSWAPSSPRCSQAQRRRTHRIHREHGPKGGGISVGSCHLHHYNIGIALLSAIGAVGLRGSEERRQHPAVAVAYGTANALVVDELALLLDLKDVYWSHDGREPVDVAIGVIALGATISVRVCRYGLTLAALCMICTRRRWRAPAIGSVPPVTSHHGAAGELFSRMNQSNLLRRPRMWPRSTYHADASRRCPEDAGTPTHHGSA